MSNILVGSIGLAALVALLVVRIPIAYAMILVGGIGTAILSGPRVVLFQLKDMHSRYMVIMLFSRFIYVVSSRWFVIGRCQFFSSD